MFFDEYDGCHYDDFARVALSQAERAHNLFLAVGFLFDTENLFLESSNTRMDDWKNSYLQ